MRTWHMRFVCAASLAVGNPSFVCHSRHLFAGGGFLVDRFRQAGLEPRRFVRMDQPLGTRLIEPLGDFAERDCLRRVGFVAERRSDLLDQRLQARHLRPILEAAFLALTISLGGIAIVGHFGF